MKCLIVFLLSTACIVAFGEDSILRYKASLAPALSESDHVNTLVPAYISRGGDADLASIQCPIPHEYRVRNYTGIQCVWSSIETLGRWAGERRLVDPPLTSRIECKGYSGPGPAAVRLRSLGVRFNQTYGDKERGLEMIREAMAEGRGALIDVPGHAMVVVHFDEEEDRVCWIDNSDDTLKAQTSSVARFMERWRTWVLVVYAEEDVVPYKVYARRMPVFDESAERLGRADDFVPWPLYIRSNGK